MVNEFSTFLQNFLGVLASNNFYAGESLTAYLRSSPPIGDEANIVDDKVASVLISALGYESGERESNLAHTGGKRTDFTVRIVEYPRPCFVVESKNTATKQLEKHLPQLADYLRSRGASRGLLIDGKRLLAYEYAGGARVSDISIIELVKRWHGEERFAAGKTGEDSRN